MKSTISNFWDKGQDDGCKKHNTAFTSRESFVITNNTGQRVKEKNNVLEAIRQYQPVTSRMLSNLTEIERTNITRSLYDLINVASPKIKEAFIDKCPETGRRVKYYTLINWQKKVWVQTEMKL